MNSINKINRSVQVWLIIGLLMIFLQVIIGGITRLTESGLSITKWEVVSGTLPPLSEKDWQEEFDLYKTTPQYKEINEGMSFDDFKFIYFWEYIHRFWARLMGFVFLIPFIFYTYKGYLNKILFKDLLLVIFLASLAATFGWIMVASGLVERPWVNAYKLSIHLMIAFSVYIALFWAYLKATYHNIITEEIKSKINKNSLVFIVLFLVVLQVFIGGVLSGMKAAVVFPTWPDMHGQMVPSIIFDTKEWNVTNFNNYDKNIFMPALVHFLHRGTAYLLFVAGLLLSYRMLRAGAEYNNETIKIGGISFFLALIAQVIIGIITVISSQGKIPVFWGVLHQGVALILITVFVFIFFVLGIKKIKK